MAVVRTINGDVSPDTLGVVKQVVRVDVDLPGSDADEVNRGH